MHLSPQPSGPSASRASRLGPAARAIPVAVALALVPAAAPAEAPRRELLEADLALAFGEGLGQAPLVMPGLALELGVGGMVGLVAGGAALIAVPEALRFLERTEVGGGITAAARLYLRGRWPRGFALGVSASLMVAGGVAALLPRAELVYRWVLGGGLSVRLQGLVGGAFLWDTEVEDRRRGPPDGAASGLLMGLALGLGWSLASVDPG